MTSTALLAHPPSSTRPHRLDLPGAPDRDLQLAIARLARTGAHGAATTRQLIDRFADAPRSRAHVGEDEMLHIAAMDEPVLRNLRITLAYHDLTVAMGDVIGLPDASWVAFATWASKTAGRFIRCETVPAALLRRAGRLPVVDDTLAEVSRCVAYGNWKVFAEVGPLFARAVSAFGRDTRYRPETIDGFVAELRPGEAARSGEGGQDLLREAFHAYYCARFEPDPKRKAELVLLANALVGLHEQTRLDVAIGGALAAPVSCLSQRLSEHAAQHLPARLARPLGRLATACASSHSPILSAWRRAATAIMMTLELPMGTLRLGDDVRGFADGRDFPDALATIDDPRLSALVERYDSDPASPRGSGSEYWDVLPDRMSYIIDLFRMYQQNALLFTPPFRPYQRRALYRDVIPHGEL